MAFLATIINVMIATPADVATERQIIRDIIHEWNAVHARDRALVLLPIAWESHASPLMGDRAQAIINKQVLEQSDLLIAVFWTRLGTPTGESPSGTVEEIDKHLSAGKPAMIYFSNAPVRPDSVDEEQYRALREFHTKCQERGLIDTYGSLEEFREKCTRQLALTVLRQFKESAPLSEEDIRQIARQPPTPPLSDEARELLVETAKDRHGNVLCIPTLAGTVVQANEREFAQRGDPRSEAKWKGAIGELVALGLLEPRGDKGEVFGITHAGYETADRLRQLG